MGALLLLASTFGMHDRAQKLRRSFSAEDDVLYLPRPSVLRVLSLGHYELMADLILIRAVLYWGGELAGARRYTWIQSYLQTIVALAPRWKTPYYWAGTAMMYNGSAITNEKVLQSNQILELGAHQFPDDWELPFMLGFNDLYELKSDDPEEQKRWRREGAEWIRRAALVDGRPTWVAELAATILPPPNALPRE